MKHAAIIDGLGGYGAVADALGVQRGTAWRWWDRGRIPVQHWSGVLALAAQTPEMAGLTSADLQAGWVAESKRGSV